MKILNYTLQWTAYLCLVALISSCVNHKGKNTKSESLRDEDSPEFSSLVIAMSDDQFDSLKDHMSVSDFIVIKESEDIMFADLDKIIEDNGIYYILDSFGAKTLVSFDSKGNAYAKYGKIGMGPGEYVRPADFDIHNSQVYILDTNSRKILRFETNGEYVDEIKIPFSAKGFKILKNGSMIFSLLPTGDGGPRICIADSILADFKYLLNSEKGYVGGFHTNNIFRDTEAGIAYYESPMDSLFCFDRNGDLYGGIVFDFGEKQVPHEAKLDYLQAKERGLLDNSLRFSDSPIHFGNGMMVATVYDGESQYILLADTDSNIAGLRKCDPRKSVYDIIEPVTADSQGNLICYTCREFLDQAEDYCLLDESVKSDLDDNEYVLLIYSRK